MVLFDKEKDLIFKIVNGILLIWFLGALMFSAKGAIDLIAEEPVTSHDAWYESNDYKDRFLYNSLANVLIVGSTMYLLNREKKEKE